MTGNVTPFHDVKFVSLLWADPERANEIAILHARVFTPAWDEPAIKALLEHPAATSLVAVAGLEKEKATVGFILGQLAADEAEIISIGVAPDWQRKGLGAKLVQGLARACARGDAKRLFLEVAEDNPAAIGLYRKAGFAEVGRRKAYYERPGAAAVDALILSLIL